MHNVLYSFGPLGVHKGIDKLKLFAVFFITDVVKTGDKFITSVNDNGDTFFTGVNANG